MTPFFVFNNLAKLFLYTISLVIGRVPDETESNILTVFIWIVLLFFISLTIFLTIQHFQIKKWRKGFFPDMDYSSDNLLKAYISLAGLMIRINSEKSNPKFYYAISHFNKHFPNSSLDFKYLLNFSLRYPIKFDQVSNWLNKHLNEDIYKLQVVYFLTGVSMVDGKVVVSEYKFLLKLTKMLKLKESDFHSILASFMANFKEERASESKRQSSRGVDFELKKSLKVLGLQEGVTFQEIKREYRKLVMKYHPDRFQHLGTDQLEIAKSHFIKIQLAYEYLEKKMK